MKSKQNRIKKIMDFLFGTKKNNKKKSVAKKSEKEKRK